MRGMLFAAMALAGAGAVGQTYDMDAYAVSGERMESVLALLALDNGDLGAVAEALEQDSPRGAMERLLEYYRERDIEYHFDIGEPLRDLEAIPDEVHDTTPLEDVMAHRFTFEQEPVQFENGIDWTHEIYDPEWAYMFHRHSHLATLVEGWRRSGDEVYMEEFAYQLMEWDQQVEPDYPRSLETGLRLRRWVRMLPVAVHAERFTADVLAVFLDNAHAMAESLNGDGFDGYSSGNWGSMQAQGVLQAGTYLPEFKQAEEWREGATERLFYQFMADTHPDGVYKGQSPSYHNVVLGQLASFYQILRQSGAEIPEDFQERTQRILNFGAAYTRPDLSLPQFGDSDDMHMGGPLAGLAELFDRPDLLYVGTQGAEGERPEWRDTLFEEGGFAIFRSDWEDGEDQRMLMFDFGPHGRGAFRLLSLDCYAYGRPLITMPGRYRYHTADGSRALFRSTPFQNTVSIDSENQTPNPARGLAHFETSGASKIVEAWHGGYSHLAGDRAGEKAIVHERQARVVRDRFWIVLDRVRLEEPAAHTYAQNWRFMPTDLAPIDGFPGRVTQFGKANIAVIPLVDGPDLVEKDGWYSPQYGVRHEAPWLVFEEETDNGWFMATLLLSYPGQEFPLKAMDANAAEHGVTLTLEWKDGREETIEAAFVSDHNPS